LLPPTCALFTCPLMHEGYIFMYIFFNFKLVLWLLRTIIYTYSLTCVVQYVEYLGVRIIYPMEIYVFLFLFYFCYF
jgi:hypothetical protein